MTLAGTHGAMAGASAQLHETEERLGPDLFTDASITEIEHKAD
jgi:hypothetical protein